MIDDKRGQERGRGRPRRGEGHDREALLEVALSCFAETGFENTSLRAIAARAGIDVALISYHYGSKLGLWTEVVASVGEESHRRLHESLKECEGDSDQERLDHVSARIVHMMSERPQFARLMVGEMIGVEDETRRAVIETRLVRPMLTLLLPLLDAKDTEGEGAAVDGVLRLIASFVMGGLVVSTRVFLSRLTPAAQDDARLYSEVGLLMARLLKA